MNYYTTENTQIQSNYCTTVQNELLRKSPPADLKMIQECWVTHEVQAQHEFHFKCLQ